MKLPNKMISYSESAISKFPSILSTLSEGCMSTLNLYENVKSEFFSVEDYLDTLDCLYALGKIEINESGMIQYVA